MRVDQFGVRDSRPALEFLRRFNPAVSGNFNRFLMLRPVLVLKVTLGLVASSTILIFGCDNGCDNGWGLRLGTAQKENR